MSTPSTGEWIARQAKLLLAFLAVALDVWSIWRAFEHERPIPVVEAHLGAPEYVAAAIFLTLTTAALLTAWSHQFWPRVRFKALYEKIAQCRDEASAIHDALSTNTAEFALLEDSKYVIRFLHRMYELQAALRPLGIDLSIGDLDKEGIACLYENLRRLAATAQIGDIRRTHAMYRSNRS
ncbi:hypothetical protein [Candidatus Poriferisodalis sp.]|uniref:hypothetical protein n=1 Tax=Candidatus Poriferisodalis sp. TaxID=3101277 RepID=UPI003B5BA1A2